MKIHSLELLQDRLDNDFVWRKKELNLIIDTMQKSEINNRDTFLRAGIAILYAHWEGYTKNSATAYLEFISHKNITCNDLKNNFKAIILKGKIITFKETNNPAVLNEITKYIFEKLPLEQKLPYDDVITTKSNLNSDIFFEIIAQLGLDLSKYELKKQLIDVKLVEPRHKIAHGKTITIDKDNFEVLHKEIIMILTTLKDEIISSAQNNEFLISNITN